MEIVAHLGLQAGFGPYPLYTFAVLVWRAENKIHILFLCAIGFGIALHCVSDFSLHALDAAMYNEDISPIC
jgi:hypothetical protein